MIPVEKNKEYPVKIESLSSDGNGIGHIDGYTIFIPQTVPGDEAVIRVVKVKSKYGYGKLVHLNSPSPDRQDALCGNFARCGGCQLMHMSYEAQLRFKQGVVQDALKRIGGADGIVVQPVVGMEESTRYRNKLVFPVSQEDGKPICGFYAPRSHQVIPVSECLLGDCLHREILLAVQDYMRESHVSAYDEQTHTGLVRRIFLRFAYHTGEIMVALSINGDALPNENDFTQRIRKVSPRIASIQLNQNQKRTNLILGGKNRLLWGKETIADTLCGITYQISLQSFYQVNPVQTERLYQKAIELANLTGKETVFDIYCGIGTISLACARYAKKVVGVEIVPQAIQDARKNAEENSIQNTAFYVGGAEQVVPKLVEDGARPDVVILDPPRKGSDEKTLSAIASAQPQRIVYVSCNPATLARDVKCLREYGYEVKETVPFDMFPNTVHVETVCLLSKKQ